MCDCLKLNLGSFCHFDDERLAKYGWHLPLYRQAKNAPFDRRCADRTSMLGLLPFYPSPGRDDGYDISDYHHINPDFGTMQHFRSFMREAKRRKLRVVTELVINHTSDQHPWFQRARRSRPRSDARNWYVWSDTDQRFADTRVIFKDTEKSNWTWDAEAQAYYWHRFFSHQPDLNYDNPRVLLAMIQVMPAGRRTG